MGTVLTMETVRMSETSVFFKEITLRYIPEGLPSWEPKAV
jgi:hypothetical protein